MPLATAVTRPFASTVATLESELAQTTAWSVASAGVKTASREAVSPAVRYRARSFRLIREAWTGTSPFSSRIRKVTGTTYFMLEYA